MGDHSIFLLLVQLALLLAVARLGAELAKRLGLPAVVGELSAGILLGPTFLGHFLPGVFQAIFPVATPQFRLTEGIGTLGMVLLLLLTGLETDLRLLRNLGRAALIASAMGMLVPFAFGFGLGLVLPDALLAEPGRRVLFSFFLATAMAISAMPVIAKILMDLDLTRRNIGVVILSAGVVDDTVGWLILSVIAGAASHGQVRLRELGFTLLMLGAFLAVVAFVLFPIARRTVGIVTRRFRTQEADLVLLMVVGLLCAAATEWMGVHAVFGAFIAGTMFRQVKELRAEAVHRLETFVFSVLAPIFFGTVGLKVDLWALGGGGTLALVLGIACLGKLVGCTLGSLWGGLRFWEGLSIAVAMNARGAMELVVATIGLSLGILNQQMFSIIVMVAIVTSFMAPLGLRLTMRKVRMTAEEEKRMLAARTRGIFDPTRVRVLLATVGGANTRAAVALAAAVAQRSAHKPEVIMLEGPVSLYDRLRRLVSRATRDAIPERAAVEMELREAGLAAEVVARERSDVAAAIVERAGRGFDLLVLGASQHSETIGGPVLEEVVRRAPCHLAIVRAAPGAPSFKRLLVPFDGGFFSRLAVEFAALQAEITGAALTIAVVRAPSTGVFAVPSPLGGPRGATPTSALPAAGDARDLSWVTPLLGTLETRPTITEIAYDPEATVLVAEASSGKYDLVVLGAENRALQHRLFFGIEKERLLHEAAISVAVVVPHVSALGA